MTVYQKLMYVSTSFAVALSVSMANYVFYDERLPDTGADRRLLYRYADAERQAAQAFLPLRNRGI